MSVLFTPQSAGSLSANVVITDNHLNGSNATHNVAVSGTGLSPITPTITWAQPSAITYGTTLSGVLNATALDGSTPVSGSFAYAATPQHGSASAVTTATVLAAGNYTLSVTFTPSDNITYTTATGSVSLTVGKVAPSVALESSANPALVGSSVTLTATVSSTVSAPSGSVSFYDGTTSLGSSTLAAGVATYATSSLASGTHAITVLYAGDSNFSPVTSSALSQVVSDVSLNVASGEARTATVSAGGTATYHLSIAPSTGSVLPAVVTFSASGAPAGSTVTITPQTIAAGAGATDVTVAIRVPAASAAVHRVRAWAFGFALPMLGLLVLPFGIDDGRRSIKGVLFAVLLLIAVVSAGAILGCGAAQVGAPPPQARNYSLRVTATSGSVSHSTTLTLTVQ